MAERFVGLSKRATVHVHRYRSHAHLEDHLMQWIEFYNLHRPHGSLGRKTPIQQAAIGYNEHPEFFLRDPVTLRDVFPTC